MTSKAVGPLPDTPTVSVIVSIYTDDRLSEFYDCLDSLQEQTYDHVEIVVMANRDAVYETLCDTLDDPSTTLIPDDPEHTLVEARNAGATHATGDIYAFIDDDAVASRHWVRRLVSTYRDQEAIAVGGPARPIWEGRGNRPAWFPAEFDWLVGATHRGFADEAGEVRNTFGCNISFRAEVFDSLDGFNAEYGKNHGQNLQGEETELCTRMAAEYGRGVYYCPRAHVDHHVYAEQQTLQWLLDRAVWQGRTKAVLRKQHQQIPAEESFVRQLLTDFLPRHLRAGVSGRSPVAGVRFLCSLLFTVAVAAGFVYGSLT